MFIYEVRIIYRIIKLAKKSLLSQFKSRSIIAGF